jgi:TetR/AcrR family transcriptional regulator, tetracycline repressor protein
MTLTRDAVVDAAVDLLGEVGLEGLSLRRLARDLGVSAPTLYWHVADKRTLLDHVAERLLADQWQVTPPAPGEDWADWLRDRAVVQYRALVAHRDAARVVAGNRPTEASMPAVEVVLGTLIDAGLSPVDAFSTVQAIGNLVIGSDARRPPTPRSTRTSPRSGRRSRRTRAPPTPTRPCSATGST